MHAAATRTSPTVFARTLFAGLPARYDRLAAVLSLGQDRRWRREMIDHVAITRPVTVLDVATGPAGVALELADRTEARITGIDLSEDVLGQGRRNVVAAGRVRQSAHVNYGFGHAFRKRWGRRRRPRRSSGARRGGRQRAESWPRRNVSCP
jgi:ubiquinone/menaquinone biosynthesis C-methylase UbiE